METFVWSKKNEKEGRGVMANDEIQLMTKAKMEENRVRAHMFIAMVMQERAFGYMQTVKLKICLHIKNSRHYLTHVLPGIMHICFESYTVC